jgi:hypothetical protein
VCPDLGLSSWDLPPGAVTSQEWAPEGVVLTSNPLRNTISAASLQNISLAPNPTAPPISSHTEEEEAEAEWEQHMKMGDSIFLPKQEEEKGPDNDWEDLLREAETMYKRQ